MKYLEYYRLSNTVFRRIVGVKKATFDLMVEVVKTSSQGKRGRRPKLCAEDRVMLCLRYMREYVTFLSIGATFGVSECVAFYTQVAIEKLLIRSEHFQLAGKKSLLEKRDNSLILTDATESVIERPKIPVKKKKRIKNRRNKQKKYYSGKKKKHTLKSQIVIDERSKEILAVKCCNGKRHDFRLYKESKVHIYPTTTALFDTGYIGIKKIHSNSLVLKRSSKKKPLTKEDKKINKAISSIRVIVENVIASIKRFKILSTRYRNRRKRFALRLNLIAGIHNFELAFN